MVIDYEYPVVTLVGSTRHRDTWIAAQRGLTLAGCIVHTVGLFGHCENLDMAGPTKKMLDKMYLKKIEMSHGILVLNKDGYIGLGAMDEISFAFANDKLVSFLEPLNTETASDMLTIAQRENSLYSNPVTQAAPRHFFLNFFGWFQNDYPTPRIITAVNGLKI